MSFLTMAIVGWVFDAMKLIFLPSDLNPCSGQGILHRGAVELGQLFVKLPVMEESFLKGVDGSLLMAEGDGHPLSVEQSNVVTKWLFTTLLDAIEVSRKLLEFFASRELLDEGVHELGE